MNTEYLTTSGFYF